MSITYAGVDLCLPTKAVCRKVERHLRDLRIFRHYGIRTEQLASSNNLQVQLQNIIATSQPVGVPHITLGQRVFFEFVPFLIPTVPGQTTQTVFLNPGKDKYDSYWTGRGYNERGYGGWGKFQNVVPLDLDGNLSDPQDISPFNGSGWEHAGSFERPRTPRLGTLYWPTGASRFAVGFFLATSEQLTEIRKKVYETAVRNRSGNAKPVELACRL